MNNVAFGARAAHADRAAPRSDSAPTLEAERLSAFYGARCALRDVSLRVRAGEVAALVGPSGCGKTTFLQCINRLVDLVPGARTTGAVRFDGVDVRDSGVEPVALRRRVGMIFQKPGPFPQSIFRNLAFPLREHGVRHRNDIADRVEQTLRAVGLWDEVCDRLGAPALALSGGQQQRLCIARALVLQPRVLLMDEPCSALDPISSGLVEDLIASFRGRYTVVVVTHNLAQARRIADDTTLFWMRDGAGYLVETARTERFFERPVDPLTAAYTSGARG